MSDPKIMRSSEAALPIQYSSKLGEDDDFEKKSKRPKEFKTKSDIE